MPFDRERYIKKEAHLLKHRRQKGKKEMKDAVINELKLMGFSPSEAASIWGDIDTEARRQQ